MVIEKHEIIDWYRDQGMGVIPLNGKIPIINEWPKIGPTDTIAHSHPGNLGANLPDDIVVLDVDPRNGGSESATRLYGDLGLKPQATLKVKTGGGGLHIYFKKPKGIVVRKNLSSVGYPGLDLKSSGGYVVIPPSLHPETGAPYSFRDGFAEIGTIPAELLDLFKRPDNDIAAVGARDKLPQCDIDQAKKIYVDWLMGSAPPAIEGLNGDDTTYMVACRGRDYGLDENNTYFCMLEYWNDSCMPAWSEQELWSKVKNAYQYATGRVGEKNAQVVFGSDPITVEKEAIKIKWDMDKGGALKKTLFNTVNFFRMPKSTLCELLRYNDFSCKLEFARKPPWQTYVFHQTWSDEDVVACKYYLSSQYNFEVPDKLIHEAATLVAMEHRVHPVRAYLDELEWDGVKRLDRWLTKYAGVPHNTYTRAVGVKLLVAAVARVFSPGCKFDYVVVLEGPQGCGKSSFCNILGGEWFADIDLDPTNKDVIHTITGKWIVELSEMETSRKAEADALKAFITRQSDRLRLPYNRYAQDIARQCVFIGSINPRVGQGYLKDLTGNRRFWPIQFGELDREGLMADRDQLFAEALQLFKLGEPLYMEDKQLDIVARTEADKRAAGDPFASVIAGFIEREDRPSYSLQELWTLALGGMASGLTPMVESRIARAMQQLGWVYTPDGFGKNRFEKR